VLATDWQHFFDIHCVISHLYDLKNLTDLQNQTGESVRFFFCLDVDFEICGRGLIFPFFLISVELTEGSNGELHQKLLKGTIDLANAPHWNIRSC
jgi:hypothetical protein